MNSHSRKMMKRLLLSCLRLPRVNMKKMEVMMAETAKVKPSMLSSKISFLILKKINLILLMTTMKRERMIDWKDLVLLLLLIKDSRLKR